uniref:VWFA domain-containing protein n=1 Tax=Labrus bergylta TaxID=56723 RepID=A0A3Q3H0R3_9LABR
MAFSPRFLFNLPVFGELLSIQPELAAFVQAEIQIEPPTLVGKTCHSSILEIQLNPCFRFSSFDLPYERQSLDFVRDFVRQLKFGPNNVQVALIQYSAEPASEFLLTTYSQKDDVLSHLSNVKLKGGSVVNTGVALDYMKNNVFTASSGSRAQQGVPQILILLSGRKSNDDAFGPVDTLKNAGIGLFSIGVNNADRLEMEQLAQSPGALYFVKEMSEFPLVREKLLSSINSFTLSSVKRDIVFLIDGSDDVRNRFPAVREFVANMVVNFDMDQEKDKVALVQYSNNAELNFHLNTYDTKEDVIKQILNQKQKGGRPQYIGAALQFVKDKVFDSTAGGRRHEGAQQILIILAGGRSRDSPRGPARMLKAAGVVTFAIWSRMSNPAEMQMISSDPNYAYSVPDFVNLPGIQNSLLSHLTQMGVDETKEGKNDDYMKNKPFLNVFMRKEQMLKGVQRAPTQG